MGLQLMDWLQDPVVAFVAVLLCNAVHQVLQYVLVSAEHLARHSAKLSAPQLRTLGASLAALLRVGVSPPSHLHRVQPALPLGFSAAAVVFTTTTAGLRRGLGRFCPGVRGGRLATGGRQAQRAVPVHCQG